MKINKIKIISIFLLPLVSASCGGGGGGGGSDLPDYSGAWTTYVNLASNTCPRVIPDQFLSINALHNVNQALNEDSQGNQILDIVIEDGADTFVGVGSLNRNGEGHSFTATGSPHELPGFLKNFKCIETIDYNYDAVLLEPNEYGDYTAGFVERHSTIICTKGTDVRTCDVSYTGTSYSYR